MPLPVWDNRVSIGNLLVAAGMPAAAATAWGNPDGRANDNAARQDGRMILIREGLSKIKSPLERRGMSPRERPDQPSPGGRGGGFGVSAPGK